MPATMSDTHSMNLHQAGDVPAWWRRLSPFVSGVPLPIFLVWAAYSAYVFLHADALVHDEIDFMVLARGVPLGDVVGAAPPALYGSLFWIGLKLAGSAYVARVVMLGMFVMTPWLLMRTIPGARMCTAVFLVWISMPIAWWGGKLIAPEIPIMFVVALALYLFDRGRLVGTAIALAAAVALKISALPAVIFFAVAYLLRQDQDWRQKLRQAPRLAAVFLVALFALCPPIWIIITELGKQPSHLGTGSLLAQAEVSLLAYRWEWDAIFSGGVLRFSLMPVPLALIALGTLVWDWRMFVGAAVTGSVFMLMSINSASAYGWYWIAYFPILAYAFSRRCDAMSNGVVPWYGLLYLAALWNGMQQLPSIVDQAYQRFEHIRILGKRDDILACVNQNLDELKPTSVYNLAEFGLTLQRDVPVYVTPGPEADQADVRLVGTRMLVGRRMASGPWPEPGYLHATCDGVLIFTRRKTTAASP